jgi:stage IV sporulation protein FB
VNPSVRILGIRVTFGPSVLVGLGALGLLSRLEGTVLVAWIGLGVVALLLHELGHALVFRRFGVPSSISFFVLGGLTTPDDSDAAAALSDPRQLAVAVAGPAVSLAVGLVSLVAVVVAARIGMTASRDVRLLVGLWLFVNLGWAIFNLLPIGSLDGGRAVRHLLGAMIPGPTGAMVGLAANLVASALIAVLAVWAGLLYIAFIAVIFGLLAPALTAAPVAPDPGAEDATGGPPAPGE